MIVSIHQPDYLPWLGLYYKMAHSDLFVYLDDAQYSNMADHNVNVIKTPQGPLKLKVPVEQHLGDLINVVRTRDELKWKDKHLRTIQMNYSKAPHFKEVFAGFSDVIQAHEGTIDKLNMSINEFICAGFGIKTRIAKSSEMGLTSFREERVLDICTKLGADEYLSGNGARAYQDEEHFSQRGIKLTYLDYKPIAYRQLWGEFIPNMCVLDYVFNCGFDWSYVEEQVSLLNQSSS